MAKTREWLRDILDLIRLELRGMPRITQHVCQELGQDLVDCPVCAALQTIHHSLACAEFCRQYGLVDEDFMTEGERILLATLGKEILQRMVENQVNQLSSCPDIICPDCGGTNVRFVTKKFVHRTFSTGLRFTTRCTHCGSNIALRQDELNNWLGANKIRSGKSSAKPNLVKEGKLIIRG